MTEKFGFHVRQDRNYQDPEFREAFTAYEKEHGRWAEGGPEAPLTDHWSVTLPHQCDSWLITGTKYDEEDVAHERAVTELTAFIAEATEALAALVERREFGEPS